MNRRVGVIAAALAFNFMFSLTVLAAPDTNNSNQTVQVNGGIEAQIQNLESSIEKLDSQIEQTLKNIDENNNGITKTENDIKKLQDQINYAENDIKDHKSVLNKRARAFYINGINGYMEMIMDSKNFDDFISRVDSIKRIMSYDEDIMNDLSKKKQEIVEQKEKLQQENKNLLALKADNEKKLAKLNEDKENQKKLIEQLKITALNDQLKGKLASLNISLESLPSKDNEIISYSYKFLGIPYLWGGTTPSGFDCSGFVQYVYANFGVGIGRTTYDQIKDGREIPVNQLQPGDLVFFGTSSDPHHVGMYIGNGMYIHAPHTGDVIKVSQLSNRGDYLTARRVK
ncbi:NlpC/P60 family protein [Clostridium magnum]|uniref:Gamma-D-glutamyl-L-lysine endopeptidase n=1 Tax=Clostridium magnum DSM 2767 TaxID=1121326 RepID=A0A162R583_9CLOT|nr:C40 family peptidase [Clostridium magnum]KZL89444.1 gamma-D-glutamyl-L-lysine endopeptidase [Clostridium magnum DSM 2767]SHI20320.1 N-terminal domain of peptidoglycan hydrolase CwlO-containing protein [Clostridium magnum DSM 2767]